jgi:hypothetical protein
MRFLRAHHITNLLAVVDSLVPRQLPDACGGRPVRLDQNEVIALLIFSSLAAPQRTLTHPLKSPLARFWTTRNRCDRISQS